MSYIKRVSLVFFILLFYHFQALSQIDRKEMPINADGLKTMIDNYQKTNGQFAVIDVFTEIESSDKVSNVTQYSSYEYKPEVFTKMLQEKPEGIEVTIPINGINRKLRLVKANILPANFYLEIKKKGVSERIVPNEEQRGLHYHGVIVGEESSSIASISFFKDQASCMISSQSVVNYFIGKRDIKNRDSKLHVGYSTDDLSHIQRSAETFCGNTDAGDLIGNAAKSTEEISQASKHKCVSIMVEADFDVYIYAGSNVYSTLSYCINLFNQAFCIYKNEGINMKMNEIYVWIGPSEYGDPVDDHNGRLADFQAAYSSFNADLAHLVTMRGQLSGKAGSIGGVPYCSTADDRMCTSDLEATSLPIAIPVWSHNVFIICHEMGHLLGSRHTHACVWNNISTAIDGCAATEGGCTNPGIPGAGQATIMSYCSLINPSLMNLYNGFGPQPRDRIRYDVYNSQCLYDCEVCYPYLILFTSPHQGPLYKSETYIHSTVKDDLIHFNVDYKAGEYILLNPGFFAGPLSSYYFQAQIQYCNYVPPEAYTYEYEERSGKNGLEVSGILNELDVNVYPNPNAGSFTISLPQKGSYSFTVMNMFGEIVYKGEIIDEQKKEILLDQTLASGNYTIHINGDNVRHVQKLTVIK